MEHILWYTSRKVTLIIVTKNRGKFLFLCEVGMGNEAIGSGGKSKIIYKKNPLKGIH